MKKSIKNLIKHLLFVVLACLPMFILAAGCATKPHSDPLAGWNFSSLSNLYSNKAVSEDYQDYLKKLSSNEKDFVGAVDFFEDGTGQHAVGIKVGAGGTWWEHILIYDKDNKRIKVIKYRNGGYQS